MIGRLDKKIDSPNRQEGKESINKTRNKSKVQRLKVNKMNKVEGAKYWIEYDLFNIILWNNCKKASEMGLEPTTLRLEV